MKGLLLLATLACGSSGASEPPPPASLDLLPNLDDDDQDGIVDWDQRGLASPDDDLHRLRVHAAGLRLSGPTGSVRVYVDGSPVLGDGRRSRWKADETRALRIGVEIADWSSAPRALHLLDPDGATLHTLQLHAEPPRVAHVLQPTEEVWVVASVDDPDWNNLPLIGRLSALLGDRLVVIPGDEVDGDVWIQDEMELTRTPDGAIFVLDSPRDPDWASGLGRMVPTLLGPDRAPLPIGDTDHANTFDGFGNVEASPPVTVEGVPYPDGRVLIGGTLARMDTEGPAPELLELLDRFGVQAPILVDTGWLCVGHIDEILAFVPDPAAPRGFRLLIASPREAYRLLDTMAADAPLALHGAAGARGHARPTAGSYARDRALRAYNLDLEDQRIADVIDTLILELALTPDEVVRVPVLFEEWIDDEGLCGAGAVIPNGINHLFLTDPDGRGGVAVLPDPSMRAPGAPLQADPFLRAWRRALPPGVRVEVVDVWDVYHVGAGEVHCATNQLRAPPPARDGSHR